MPQSLSKVYTHIIFSTKHRRNLIDETIQPDFRKFLKTYDVDYDERYVWD